MLNRRNNRMTRYNPFQEMESMERNFFDDPFRLFGEGRLTEFGTDIIDEGDCYKLEADLPGFSKEDIHLDIEGDVLILSAERHSEHEDRDKQGKYVRCERSYGSYRRTFDISNVKIDEMKAAYANGVLTLTMPKKERSVPSSRRIEIE